MDSNNDDTEVPEDQPKEQALQLNVKDFACRSKSKAKPQRSEPAGYSPSIIPMNERNWIVIEPKNLSLRTRFSKKVIHLFRHSQQVQREDDGRIKNIFRVNLHKFLIGLTIDGKHAWQQEGGAKRRYQYCTDVSGTIVYLRALQGHSGTQSY